MMNRSERNANLRFVQNRAAPVKTAAVTGRLPRPACVGQYGKWLACLGSCYWRETCLARKKIYERERTSV